MYILGQVVILMTGRSNDVRYLRGKWNRAAQLCTRVFTSAAA